MEWTRNEGLTGLMSGAANLAHEAADTMMEAASTSASSVKRQVSEVLDRQVASGARRILVEYVGDAVASYGGAAGVLE